MSPENSLDKVYHMVLRNALNGAYKDEDRSVLIDILNTRLGSIAILAAPLNINTLACISANTADAIDKAFHSLHSILNIPENLQHPIRLHHATFCKFILNPDRCTDLRFIVDGKEQHKRIALSCVRLMCQHLRKDICDLRAIGASLSDIQPGLVDERLFTALCYACCYWVHHVCEGDVLSTDVEAISAFLREHLLHWLEALSLIERLRDSILMLGELEQIMVRELLPSTNSLSRTDDGGFEGDSASGRTYIRQ